MPPVAAHDFGSFTPMPGVVAHRVTYGTQFGMRVTAIVYRPDHVNGKFPLSSSSLDMAAVSPLGMRFTPGFFTQALARSL